MREENLGYIFTAEETALLRRKYIEKNLIPPLRFRFDRHPQLQSAALFVAQYWDDEAIDAVHDLWVFSVLETPDFEYPFSDSSLTDENWASMSPGESGETPTFSKIQEQEDDPINLPNLPSHSIINWVQSRSHPVMPWDRNGMGVTLFAAFCKENVHRGMKTGDAYSLFAIFHKTADGIDIEYVGKMLRPWLDGIRPESFQKYPEHEPYALDQLLKDTAG